MAQIQVDKPAPSTVRMPSGGSLSATSQNTLVQEEPSVHLKRWRKVYGFLGFHKGYNFPLFIIFGGAMLGFIFARLSYLNIGGDAPSSLKSDSSPGEWYWLRAGARRIGITLHLAGCLPAGFLMVWQFVPIIRHKFILFHRLNGYAIILLVLISNAGALIIAQHTFGGDLSTQAAVGFLAIVTTTGMAMAWYNIKRQQIDQHRAWMLRTMFYLGSIITVRIIMTTAATIISTHYKYYTAMSCNEILFFYKGDEPTLLNFYPECSQGGDTRVAVLASSKTGLPENIVASLNITFGTALWLAYAMHFIGVEIYLNLTPREANRLRQVSYERQLERGFKNPGSAGLVVERLGDADPWVPNVVNVKA